MLKRLLYDYKGNLMQITVYGYIDGDRASNSKMITYEYDPPPMIGPPPGTASPKLDPRNSFKFKYKHDDSGNLVEEMWYANDGKLWMRYVYTRKGNVKERLAYAENGSLNQKSLSVIDDNGNIIESTFLDPKTGSVTSKYSYKYEYDSKGNWIKQTQFKMTSRDGKTDLEPASVTYHAITYY